MNNKRDEWEFHTLKGVELGSNWDPHISLSSGAIELTSKALEPYLAVHPFQLILPFLEHLVIPKMST